MHEDHSFLFLLAGHVDALDVQANQAAAVALARFVARPFHQNAPHGFGGGGKKVTAVLPLLLFLTEQAQVGFVDQGGWLEGLPGLFLGHLHRGELAEFLINQRQQFIDRRGLTTLDPLQNERQLTHVQKPRYVATAGWQREGRVNSETRTRTRNARRMVTMAGWLGSITDGSFSFPSCR